MHSVLENWEKSVIWMKTPTNFLSRILLPYKISDSMCNRKFLSFFKLSREEK